MNKPYPGRDASSLSPIFPFTSQFNNGLDVNPGTRITVDGNLNVPIMGWGIWDYKGGVKVGRPNTRVGFGSLVRPTNVLGITPETIAILGSNSLFNEARRKSANLIVTLTFRVLSSHYFEYYLKLPSCSSFFTFFTTYFMISNNNHELLVSLKGVEYNESNRKNYYNCSQIESDICCYVVGRLPSIPVAVLPGNFVPLRCKPPFCNPFLHNLGFGVDVEPGDDILFDGGADFPIPLAPGGIGVRYPLSGAVNVGSDPFLLTYGHGLGPVEPPNFKTKNTFKTSLNNR
uniref:Peptidase A1 domain-containing protein n=1 Tax=Syphacia muris TaxID=451379 RepID=A0A0N5AED5_9BILA